MNWAEASSAISQNLAFQFLFSRIGIRRGPLPVLSKVLGKAALMVALLLPVKILVIIDSSSIPAYFPASLRILSLNELVLLLGIASLLSYAIYTVMAVLEPGLIGMVYRRSAGVIEAEFSRLGLSSIVVSSPEKLRKLITVSAETVLSLLGLVFLSFTFKLVLWLYILALAIILTRVAFLLRRDQPQESAWSQVRKGPAVRIAFLFSVGAVIVSALVSVSPNLLTMMLSLLLLRQGLGASLKSGETVAKALSRQANGT